jgi:hypothetical protein
MQPESEETATREESIPAGFFIAQEESVPEVDVTHVPQSLRSGVRCGTLRLACKIGDVSLNAEQWQFLLSLVTVGKTAQLSFARLPEGDTRL